MPINLVNKNAKPHTSLVTRQKLLEIGCHIHHIALILSHHAISFHAELRKW